MENISTVKKPLKSLKAKNPIRTLKPRSKQEVDELEEFVNQSHMDNSNTLEDEELEIDELEETLSQIDMDHNDTFEDEYPEDEELQEAVKPTPKEKQNQPQSKAQHTILQNEKSLASSKSQLNEKHTLGPLQELVKQTSVIRFSSSSGRGGLISIVKSSNGTRFVISKSVNEELGYPTEIYFGCENDHLIMFNSQDTPIEGKKIPANNKGKLIIYDAALVNDIVEAFNLDYSDVTSKSFAQGHFEDKGRPVLYVKMV